MSVIVSLLPLAAFAFFACRRLLRYLHIFQQEDYAPRRFVRWIVAARAFDKRLSAALAVLLLAALLVPFLPLAVSVAEVAIFILFTCLESDPRKTAKKKLVMTRRAWRICIVAAVLCILIGLYAALIPALVWPWIVAVQLIPLTLVIANILLMPVESHIQRRIMRQASERLAQVAPKTIGITGSFGKTSVKHILGHILEMNAPTLYTPGSVNTLMGISRIINEKLQAGCRFFLVEMGAYGIGSIRKLCRLTPPVAGIVTSIGEAHYERFKTLDAVARAKFELAEEVLMHPEGKMVVHEDVLAQPYACDFVAKNRDRFILCGPGDEADLKIVNATQSAAGLTVNVVWPGRDYTLFAPLYGMAHAGNMALGFTIAVMLGIDPERAVASLRTVPQIKHRLEVKLQADGIVYIDDAYNSNPRGFAAALDVLAGIAAEKGGRAILMTPGIIELGAKHDEAHAAIGEKAAQTADIALVIRADRMPTFVASFQAKAPHKPLYPFASLAEAQAWVRAHARAGDVILIENDLPDLGEAKITL